MSKHITFNGAFVKQFYGNTVGAGTRVAGNPALPSGYGDIVPAPIRRVYLFIQNKGTTEVDLDLHPAAAGATIKLYAGQSISLDNYNGAFSLSSYTDIAIIEAFA